MCQKSVSILDCLTTYKTRADEAMRKSPAGQPPGTSTSQDHHDGRREERKRPPGSQSAADTTNQCCPAGRPGRPCEYRTIMRSPPRVWTQELSPFLSGATRGRRNIHPGAPAAVTTTHRPQQVAIVTVIPLFQIPVLGIRKRRAPVIGQ